MSDELGLVFNPETAHDYPSNDLEAKELLFFGVVWTTAAFLGASLGARLRKGKG